MSAPPPPGSSSPDSLPRKLRLQSGDELYPPCLHDLGEEAPNMLWAQGSLEALRIRPCVAVVGTRRATAYGHRVTRELTIAFVRAGASVVSGLAIGIDAAAHQATLEAGGTALAVLGTGLGLTFPRRHRALQDEIGRRGLLLTELEDTMPGMKHTFLKRNRIIAALADLTIVVEAPERSGALNTAQHAVGLGRCVAAVPGPIDQPQSAGTNLLIRDGAQVITSVEDALALVGLTPPARVPKLDPAGDEGRVWAALGEGPLSLDTLCSRSALPAARCLAAVTKLELSGGIECLLTGEIRRR